MADLSTCREQFPSLQRMVNNHPVIYFDGPGGTQVPRSVIDAMVQYYEHSNANVGGEFAASRETDEVIEQARRSMAAFLGAESPETISFGQNMTSLNFALARAIGRTIPAGDEVIVTDLDHDANVAPWLTLAERGAVIRRVPIRPDSTLDMEQFASLINERTKLVAVGYASNALGTVTDLTAIRQWTREVGALMVVDAVHYAPHISLDVAALDPDFLLCSAYKFFGPHVGILYSRAGALQPLTTDRVRPQRDIAPEKIETGTLNHAALAGVIAAVQFMASLAEKQSGTLRERLVEALNRMYVYEHELAGKIYHGLQQIAGVTIYGTPVGESLRTPTISFTIKGVTPTEVARRLGQAGINVWAGHFYAITVVEQLGLMEQGGLVRLGLAPYNTAAEADRFLEVVTEIAQTAAAGSNL